MLKGHYLLGVSVRKLRKHFYQVYYMMVSGQQPDGILARQTFPQECIPDKLQSDGHLPKRQQPDWTVARPYGNLTGQQPMDGNRIDISPTRHVPNRIVARTDIIPTLHQPDYFALLNTPKFQTHMSWTPKNVNLSI